MTFNTMTTTEFISQFNRVQKDFREYCNSLGKMEGYINVYFDTFDDLETGEIGSGLILSARVRQGDETYKHSAYAKIDEDGNLLGQVFDVTKVD